MPRGHFDKSKSASRAVLISDSFGEVAFRGAARRPASTPREVGPTYSRQEERKSRHFPKRGTVVTTVRVEGTAVTTVRLNGNLRGPPNARLERTPCPFDKSKMDTMSIFAKARLTQCQSCKCKTAPGAVRQKQECLGGTLAQRFVTEQTRLGPQRGRWPRALEGAAVSLRDERE